mmetsp:Transcript_52268/g.150521  ORF Transcript_52268/g.150521 Transcript_52268/m.150521 type:complete len:251 (-) Transcript_52268:101-853(-)
MSLVSGWPCSTACCGNTDEGELGLVKCSSICTAAKAQFGLAFDDGRRGAADLNREDGAAAVGDAGAEVFGEIVRPPVVYIAKVNLPKNSSPVTLHLDVLHNGALRINAIVELSPFAIYNGTVDERSQIRAGDCIIMFNGEPAAGADYAVGGIVELKLCRPSQFTVRDLDKTKGPLGLQVVFAMSSTAIYLSGIAPDSVIEAYNRRSPASAVRAGDLIVAVNGTSGNASELMKTIRDSDVLELSIDRIADA